MEYSETINGVEYTAEVTYQNGKIITRRQIGDEPADYANENHDPKYHGSTDDDSLLALAKLEVAQMAKTGFAITAENHGLGNVPCNVAQTLFGEFAAADQFSTTSRTFQTRGQAEAALAALESSGDWPDGAPDYEIVEVKAVANG